MKRGSTNAKRKPLAVVVEPVVGDDERIIVPRIEIEINGCSNGGRDDWMIAEVRDGDLTLFINDRVLFDDEGGDSLGNIGPCKYVEGIPRAAAIALRDFLNYAIPNPSGQSRADCGAYSAPHCSTLNNKTEE